MTPSFSVSRGGVAICCTGVTVTARSPVPIGYFVCLSYLFVRGLANEG